MSKENNHRPLPQLTEIAEFILGQKFRTISEIPGELLPKIAWGLIMARRAETHDDISTQTQEDLWSRYAQYLAGRIDSLDSKNARTRLNFALPVSETAFAVDFAGKTGKDIPPEDWPIFGKILTIFACSWADSRQRQRAKGGNNQPSPDQTELKIRAIIKEINQQPEAKYDKAGMERALRLRRKKVISQFPFDQAVLSGSYSLFTVICAAFPPYLTSELSAMIFSGFQLTGLISTVFLIRPIKHLLKIRAVDIDNNSIRQKFRIQSGQKELYQENRSPRLNLSHFLPALLH